MQEKLARALGIAGFLAIAGGAGGFEQGGSELTYLIITLAGAAMAAASIFWYDYQCIKAERRRQSLKYRGVRHNENGFKRRSDSY